MWISQAAWLKNREEFIELQKERDAAVAQVNGQNITLGWFMHRLTQVEQERSKLIYNFTGVRVEAPTYQKEDAAAEAAASLLSQNPLNSLPNFNDVGEAEALRQGITWNADGELVYTK